MSDTSRQWWTWPRVLFAVWSVILSNWVTFALSHHSPWWLYPIMWSVLIVMAIVATLGEVIAQTRRPVPLANLPRPRDPAPVVPPDVDPVRRQERTEVIPVRENGAVASPRHRVSAAAPVSYGTVYGPAPEPKAKKQKRPASTDVPPLDLSERLGSELESFTKGYFAGRSDEESDDPPAEGAVEDRP